MNNNSITITPPSEFSGCRSEMAYRIENLPESELLTVVVFPEFGAELGRKRFTGTPEVTVGISPLLKDLFPQEPALNGWCGFRNDEDLGRRYETVFYIGEEKTAEHSGLTTFGRNNARENSLMSDFEGYRQIRPDGTDILSFRSGGGAVTGRLNVMTDAGERHYAIGADGLQECGIPGNETRAGAVTDTTTGTAVTPFATTEGIATLEIDIAEILYKATDGSNNGNSGARVFLTLNLHDEEGNTEAVIAERGYIVTESAGKSFFWINRYGAIDSFCMVETKRNPAFMKQSAYTLEGYREIYSESEELFSADSGLQPQATLLCLEEMVRSPKAWIRTGTDFEAVYIDSGTQISQESGNPASFRISYRPVLKSTEA